MFLKILRRLSSYVQGAHSSFARHNAELEESTAFETEKKISLDRLASNMINDPEHRVDDLLKLYPHIKTAVDVGSGAGWASAAVSSRTETVTAIEPSRAGIDIAKGVFTNDQYKNITWIQGFAEDILPTLKLNTPTLFLTGCVLSHIRDKEVIKICKAINDVAPQGSVMSLAECFGDEPWHQLMWHVRTKTWWQEQFPGWELTFHGPQVPNTNYFKGIWGVKK
jgi:trans-aconitate methyltransferase